MSDAQENVWGVDIGVYPGIEPRLLTTTRRESGEDYLRAGGYRPVTDPSALYRQVERSRLRGHGGAAFPVARKIATVRDAGVSPVVLANGEEGEPASIKDRWLMRHRPHLVLDGVRLAAALVGAQEAVVYVSDPLSADSIEAALAEYPAEGWVEFVITVHRVESSYVAGEESAAVRSINGGPALPTEKPPRPFERGVRDRPTLVSNVETLANLPLIQRIGGEAFAAVGTEDSAGTFLMTLSVAGRVGLYELPFGITLRDVVSWTGGRPECTTAVLVGGYFAGLAGPGLQDVPLEYGAFAAAGTGLGCGAMVLLDEGTCPVYVAADVLDYFGEHNAGQCGSCFNGTVAMAAVVAALTIGTAQAADVDRLRRWSIDLRGRGACGTLDGATNVAASLLREFPDEVDAHLTGACQRCAQTMPTGHPPFAVDPTGAKERVG